MLILLSVNNCFSQDKIFPVGLLVKLGIASGRSDSSRQLTQQVASYDYRSWGFGVYGFIPLGKNQTKERVFQFIRIDLGSSVRRGAFESSNGTLARISTYAIDLNLSVPVVFDMGKSVKGYGGFGINCGYIFDSNILPVTVASQFVSDSKFIYGSNIEFGLILGSSSFIAIRPVDSIKGDFRFQGATVVFGFSPQGIKGKTFRLKRN